jgi:hypothetical protein
MIHLENLNSETNIFVSSPLIANDICIESGRVRVGSGLDPDESGGFLGSDPDKIQIGAHLFS